MNYHISPDGKTRPCKAKICPFGTRVSKEYLENKKEIDDTYRKLQENNKEYSEELCVKRGEFVNETTKVLLNAKKDTYSLYYNEKNGEWSEDRKRLHTEIISKLYDKYKNVPCDKKVIFSAGLPGAGKTTVLNKLDNIGIHRLTSLQLYHQMT